MQNKVSAGEQDHSCVINSYNMSFSFIAFKLSNISDTLNLTFLK